MLESVIANLIKQSFLKWVENNIWSEMTECKQNDFVLVNIAMVSLDYILFLFAVLGC